MTWASKLRPTDRALAEAVRTELYKRMPPEKLWQSLQTNRAGAEREIVLLTQRILSEWGTYLGRQEQRDLERHVLDEIIGFGPLQPLIEDPRIQEIMVNGPFQVWIERDGVLEESSVRFTDQQHAVNILHRIVDPLGRRIDLSSPLVNARLPDGSRVNAVIKPLALDGPVITIRKFRERRFTLKELVRSGSLSVDSAQYLQACVKGRLNILVSGGTGSGKTTLLNILSGFIPETERIVTVEDAAELQLSQRHVVRLESRPANIEGSGAIPIRDLVVNALRMRPDRIIVGEVRGGEAVDMLQAMNTGHEGSMTTAHANSGHHVISRLETMFLMSGLEVPIAAIRRQIADAFHVIVHQDRMEDGSRRVVSISEVLGMQGAEVELQDLFTRAAKTGEEDEESTLQPTGVTSRYLSKLRASQVELPEYLTRRGDA